MKKTIFKISRTAGAAVILTIVLFSLCACGSSSSSTGKSSGKTAGTGTSTGAGIEAGKPSINIGQSTTKEVHPSEMTASNDLARYIRKPLGTVLDAFPDFTQLEGGDAHPAYGNDSLWFAFIVHNGEYVCDYIRVRGAETPYTIYGIGAGDRPAGDDGWGKLMDEMMAKGFDEGGSGELLDAENNCLYIGGLYDEDLPYVSLTAYDLERD